MLPTRTHDLSVDNEQRVVRCCVVSRRHFLLTSLAGLTSFLTASPLPALAKKASAFQTALDGVLKGAVPSKGLLRLTVPSVAENGNVVAFGVDASALEQEGVMVDRLYLLATDNPWPFVGVFHFSPLSGTPAVRSRLRLARSQRVVALAEGHKTMRQADGTSLKKTMFFLSEADVKVVIGGCGG